MDASERGQAEPTSEAQTAALIKRLEEALRRTVAAVPTCPYCDVPSYLRRHHDRCGLKQMLEEAQTWLARQQPR